MPSSDVPAAPGAQDPFALCPQRARAKVESHERVRQTLDRDAQWRRLAYVAEATTLLSSSLDADWCVQSIVDLAVPRFADWCVVETPLDTGGSRVQAEAHADVRRTGLAREIRRFRSGTASSPYSVTEVMRDGRAVLMTDVSEAIADRRTIDPEDLRIYASLGVTSALMLPMSINGSVVAALCFFSLQLQRRFDREDLAAMEQLALVASATLEHCRLYQRADQLLRASEDLVSAAVCHELRTPLSAVLLQLENLQQRLTDQTTMTDKDAVAKGIAKALNNARRLANRLEKVLSNSPSQ
jgi:signal transduction histidine kinase